MDKSDKILAAIEQLARNLTGQIQAVDAKVDAVRADVARVDAKVDAVAADLTGQIEAEAKKNAEFRTDVRLELRGVNEHLSGIDKRQDDQNVILAALIPAKIAAVGGR